MVCSGYMVKQAKFEFVGKYISFLYRYHQTYLDKELEPYNIGSGQFFILMPLYKKDGINQEKISQIIKVDKATITRAITRLIDEGYVIRERDENDRRAYKVFLTKKGKGIKRNIMAIAQRWDDIILANMDMDQHEAVKTTFCTMYDNVSEYTNS